MIFSGVKQRHQQKIDVLCISQITDTGRPGKTDRLLGAIPLILSEKQEIEMFYPKNYNSRSQDLGEAFHDAGQFYWGLTDAWLENKKIISDEASSPILIPRNRAMDIDTIEDWQIAERMFEVINKKKMRFKLKIQTVQCCIDINGNLRSNVAGLI